MGRPYFSVPASLEQVKRITPNPKTAAVEVAVDSLLADAGKPAAKTNVDARFAALLRQLDRIPDLPGASNPLEWDEHGLPK